MHPYTCPAGKWTIGYGTTKGVTSKHPPITKEQAEKLLIRDMQAAENLVDALVTVPLNINQTAALISLVYNIGGGHFKDSTLLKKLNAGDYAGAAERFLVWRKAGVMVLPGLVKRREAERELFLKPVT